MKLVDHIVDANVSNRVISLTRCTPASEAGRSAAGRCSVPDSAPRNQHRVEALPQWTSGTPKIAASATGHGSTGGSRPQPCRRSSAGHDNVFQPVDQIQASHWSSRYLKSPVWQPPSRGAVRSHRGCSSTPSSRSRPGSPQLCSLSRPSRTCRHRLRSRLR